jgi:hypothetical protein
MLHEMLGALDHVRPRGGGDYIRFQCETRDLNPVHDGASERHVNTVVVHSVVVSEIEPSGRA